MSKIEDRVCEKVQNRSEHGLEKYGVTLERKDLDLLDWLNHFQEELMDACGYVEVIIQMLDNGDVEVPEKLLELLGGLRDKRRKNSQG